MTRALVTGATGFTGWHLARRLKQDGHFVRVLVRPSSAHEHIDPLGVEVARGDLRDPSAVRRAVDGVDTVYHIAAAYRDGSLSNAQMLQVNGHGAQLLVEMADRARVRRFVHCSTVGVHGDVKHPPADETAPIAPGDGYQRSKLVGERAVLAYQSHSGMGVSAFRPCAIYGPGDLRLLKWFQLVKKGLMIGNGKPLYHMVYIDDLIDGILLCGTHARAVGEVFILGGDTWADLNTISRMIADALETTAPRWRIPFMPAYVAAALCELAFRPLGLDPPLYRRRIDFFRKNRAFDISKARRLLGYAPAVSLDEGIRRTGAWYRSKGLV